jgi:hypothetical protein
MALSELKNGGIMKQTHTTRRLRAIQNFGSDASFVANVIMTQHSKPATKLRNVLSLLERGWWVKTAQHSIDTLLVDGRVVPWSALDNMTAVLDIINPRYDQYDDPLNTRGVNSGSAE